MTQIRNWVPRCSLKHSNRSLTCWKNFTQSCRCSRLMKERPQVRLNKIVAHWSHMIWSTLKRSLRRQSKNLGLPASSSNWDHQVQSVFQASNLSLRRLTKWFTTTSLGMAFKFKRCPTVVISLLFTKSTKHRSQLGHDQGHRPALWWSMSNHKCECH